MRSKDKRMTAANAFWALDALTVILLGVRLCGETFYVYSHAGHAELSDEYWITAGAILLDYLPILLCLTLAATALTLAAVAARRTAMSCPPDPDTAGLAGSADLCAGPVGPQQAADAAGAETDASPVP